MGYISSDDKRKVTTQRLREMKQRLQMGMLYRDAKIWIATRGNYLKVQKSSYRARVLQTDADYIPYLL